MKATVLSDEELTIITQALTGILILVEDIGKIVGAEGEQPKHKSAPHKRNPNALCKVCGDIRKTHDERPEVFNHAFVLLRKRGPKLAPNPAPSVGLDGKPVTDLGWVGGGR